VSVLHQLRTYPPPRTAPIQATSNSAPRTSDLGLDRASLYRTKRLNKSSYVISRLGETGAKDVPDKNCQYLHWK